MRAARVVALLLSLAAFLASPGCANSAPPRCSLEANPTTGAGHLVDEATWNAHPALRAIMTKTRASSTLDCAEARAILKAVDGPAAPPASLALTHAGATWFVDFLDAPPANG